MILLREKDFTLKQNESNAERGALTHLLIFAYRHSKRQEESQPQQLRMPHIMLTVVFAQLLERQNIILLE